MKLVMRGRPELRQSRRARFEQLEPRHLLAAANVALTANADVQQMPSVAVDPMHPNHVVVAYMDYSLFDKTDDPTTPNVNESYDHPYAGIGIAESSDSGDHWQYSSIPLPQGFLADKDHATGLAAPTIKFDNVDRDGDPTNGVQNRVYVVFMAVEFLSDKKPPLTNPTGAALRSLGFQANNGIFVSYSD